MVALVVMLAMREITGRESLVELIAHTTLQAMPIGMFAFFLDLLEEEAKPVLLASVMLGVILVCGGIARIDGGPSVATTPGRRVRRVIWLILSLWLPCSLFAVFVTTYVSVEGVSNRGLLAVTLDLFVDSAAYAVALYALFPLVRRATPEWGYSYTRTVDAPPADAGRRRVIAQIGTGAIALVSVSYLGNFLKGITGGSLSGGRGVIPEPITPNDEFYLISKNFIDPSVSEDDWTLEITGAVQNLTQLAYIDLLELQSVDQLTTLTCISNKVGGDLISNARWTGVPLATILASAGIRADASGIAIYAEDGYTESLPLSKALTASTMVVYLMNGEPLPKRHGHPVRLIVPGKYGIKNVKWVKKIELIGGEFKGYWQQRGWTQDATIKTMSRIDVPSSRAIVKRGPQEIGGVAFAGDRGISKVEFMTDGVNWVEATLEQVAPLSWVIWRSTWNPTTPGAYSITVRATDGTGVLQTEDTAKPIPDGASGYHIVDVGVT